MKMHKFTEASGPHWLKNWNSPATTIVHAADAIKILKRPPPIMWRLGGLLAPVN
jgi:hypothetical protein